MFQARVYLHLLREEHYNHAHHLRTKLEKWSTNILPGVLERRAPRILQNAFTLVNTRVAIVLLRAWLNGWCTADRFQNHDAPCLFGCHSTCSADSIKHYAHCKIVKEFAHKHLLLPSQSVNATATFLCLDSGIPDVLRTLELLLLYATYSATNSLRFCGHPPQISDSNELLLQYVHQGTFNHSASQDVVANIQLQRAAKRRRVDAAARAP